MNSAELKIPERWNYVAAFLTFACNLDCSYCINRFNGAIAGTKSMDAADWIRGLNRLKLRPDLPVTLQGGEPSLHPGFIEIINGLREDIAIDVLTNLEFDVKDFMRKVPPGRLRRQAPYASIRVSYHPEVMKLDPLRARVLDLLGRGYSVGVWGVMHPRYAAEIERAREVCRKDGIDFRIKEFLGELDGILHGTYKYPEAVSGRRGPPVECRTSELIIGPSGSIYRCHSDLYAGRKPVGHLADPDLVIEDVFRPCSYFGLCNPCDIKVKTDRFQVFGHTSVEVRF